MTTSAPRRRWALLGVPAALLIATPLLSLQVGSAAQLHVTAAPLQTWVLTELEMPELPRLGNCGPLSQYDDIVFGTRGNDVLQPEKSTGNRRQVFVGLEGDDVIQAGNHGDCLVGGRGDDVLTGGNGRDVLVGGRGADTLDGGTGKDSYYAGGEAGDTCHVKGAPDDPMDGCQTVVLTELDEEPDAPAPNPTPTPTPDPKPGGGKDDKGGPGKSGSMTNEDVVPPDDSEPRATQDVTPDGGTAAEVPSTPSADGDGLIGDESTPAGVPAS